jgi:hypothetical protein
MILAWQIVLKMRKVKQDINYFLLIPTLKSLYPGGTVAGADTSHEGE